MQNATFPIRNYLNGALLYYHHICQRGGDDNIIKEELYKGTSKSAEGYAARITSRLPSTGRMLTPPLPTQSVKCFLMPKLKTASKQMLHRYRASFPALCELSCNCKGGCLNPPFISKRAHKFHLDFDGCPIAGRICETPGSTT